MHAGEATVKISADTADFDAALARMRDQMDDLADVRRLALRPGDTLVVTLRDSYASAREINHVQALVEARFPGHTVLVICGGTLTIVGADDDA